MSTVEPLNVGASPRAPRPTRNRPGRKPEGAADSIVEALRLLKRQAQIRDDLRVRRGCYIVAERELLIRNRLAQFPPAVQAITLTAAELQRPVDTLSLRDVATRSGLPRAVTRDASTHTTTPR